MAGRDVRHADAHARGRRSYRSQIRTVYSTAVPTCQR